MDETVLQNLIVRLTGDGSSYQQMLRMAQDSVQQVGGVVQQGVSTIQGYGNAVQSYVKTWMSGVAALNLKHFLEAAFEGFERKETLLIQLSSAIEQHGDNVKEVIQEYKEFASAMTEITTKSGPDVLALLQQATTMYGMTGAAAEKAVQQAIGYEAATGRGGAMALRIISMVNEGNAKMVGTRFFMPQLMGKHLSDAEKLVKAQEYLKDMFKVAAEMAETAGGQIKQMTNAWNAFRNSLGEAVAEGIKPVVMWLKELYLWLNKLPADVKMSIVAAAALAAGLLSIGPAIAMIGFYVSTFLNPMIYVISAIGIALAAWITRMGGIEEAWKKIEGPVKEGLDSLLGILALFIEGLRHIRSEFVDEWNPLADAVDNVETAIEDLWKTSVGWISDFISGNKDLIGTLTVTAIVTAGVIGLVKLAILAYSGLSFIWGLLKVQKIADLVIWGLSTIAVTSYNAAIFLLGLDTVILNAATSAAVFVVNLFTGSVTLATIATVALDAALAALAVIFAPVTLIAVTIALIAIGAAFVTIGSAVAYIGITLYAVWKAVEGVADAFSQLGGSSELERIGQVLGGWWDDLKLILQVAKTDWDKAWFLLTLRVKLAVSELQDLWPPFWELLQEGFRATWDLIVKDFQIAWNKGLRHVLYDFMDQVQRQIGDRIGINFIKTEEQVKMLNDLNEFDERAATQMASNAEDAAYKIQQAMEKAGSASAPSELTKNLKIQSDLEIAEALWRQAQGLDEVVPKALKTPPKAKVPEDKLKKKHAGHEEGKFDAAAFGSAEATFRIQQYRDKLAHPKGVEEEQRDLLKDIRDHLENIDEEGTGMGLGFADLGGV